MFYWSDAKCVFKSPQHEMQWLHFIGQETLLFYGGRTKSLSFLCERKSQCIVDIQTAVYNGKLSILALTVFVFFNFFLPIEDNMCYTGKHTFSNILQILNSDMKSI